MARKDDRDTNGRFAPGNSGGPGRPKRHIEVEYMTSMLSVCTLSEWEEIVRQAVTLAKEGDHKARDWLTSHVLGPSGAKPATYTELSSKQKDDDFFGIL